MPCLELTDAQLRVVQEALEAYRLKKGAERMLKCQRDANLWPQYDKLRDLIATTQQVVGKPKTKA